MKKILKIIPIALVTLLFCGFGFKTEASDCRIKNFSIDKTGINKGDAITLEWETEGCSDVKVKIFEIDTQNTIETEEVLIASGKKNYSPQKSTSYTLVARKSNNKDGGGERTQTVGVRVSYTTCNIIKFKADKETITKGETVTLEWETENCDDVRITGIKEELSLSGNKKVSPEVDINYRLIAGQNDYDFKTEKNVSIKIKQEQKREESTPPAVPVTAQQGGGGSEDGSTYKLLAPLGDYTHASIDPKDPNFVGGYLNTMFLFAIGIITALAVVMLIVAGIQYMGQESVFTKTKAKEQITNAILGLIIALGSFAILNTISPTLVGDGGLFVGQVEIKIDEKIHSDTGHQPIMKDGKAYYCGGGQYLEHSEWGNEKEEEEKREELEKAGISVKSNYPCKTVGQPNCTSLHKLDISKVIELKKKCPDCEIVITGGTECWLHGVNSAHKPGGNIVDLRLGDKPLEEYIEKGSKVEQSKLGPVYTREDGSKFLKEKKDHYHVMNW